MRVRGLPTTASEVAGFILNLTGQPATANTSRILEIVFYKGEPKVGIKKVKVKRYQDNEIKKMVHLFADYAIRNKKEAIIGNTTKNFYKL